MRIFLKLGVALQIFVDRIEHFDGEPVGLDQGKAATRLTVRRAFRYAGSLTTPPCSEGVKWVVLATPITASGPQIAALARVLQGNARPPQPRHERELLLDSTP